MKRRWLIALLMLAAAAGAAVNPVTAQERGAVLVFGGTGKLGSDIVKGLVGRSEKVIVFARRESKADLLKDLPVSYAVGDLFNATDVGAVFATNKVRAVIIALRVEDNDTRFYEKALTAIVGASKRAGVAQVIHHGAVGAGDNARNFTALGWEKVPGLLDRLKDQGIGEDLLKASGVPYTIIRNARIWPEATPATGKAVLTEDQTTMTPMTRADLANLTLQCLDNASCLGKTYHVRDESLTWPPPGRG
jgi:uncharacterized protein YbjT (DUF2867 family)